MKRLSLRVFVAVVTFVAGIYASAVWFSSLGQTTQRVAPPESGVTIAAPPASGPTLEMVFVIDTTGSMGGLIEGAKQRVWGIVNEAMQSESRPAVRVGLVAYRDRGDQYVTQVLPLTDDLDKVYSTLMDFQAGGGGDTPENVRRALADGVHQAGWTRAEKGGPAVAQILFLVGDAPPKPYADEPDTLKTTAEAISRGITVNAIQCGQLPGTREAWQAIAQHGEGRYFAIAQDGGVQNFDTPYDTRLAELGTKLGSTFTPYGGGAGAGGVLMRREAAAKQATTETKIAAAAPVAAQAERAINKSLNSVAYVGDLLQNIENGTLKLESVKDEDLPDDLRRLPADERRKEIERRLSERRRLRAEIVTLSKQRDGFIAAEKQKRNGGRQDGFDSAVASALKEQMARRGIK